jgi:choice-of-anchor A domain-containing protein
MKHVTIQGSAKQKVIINVLGSDFDLSNVQVDLLGTIKPENIVWNFSSASSLKMIATKSATYGWPGQIVAPQASFEFYEGRLTGAVYVRNFVYRANTQSLLKTGQINDARVSLIPKKKGGGY